MGEADIAVCVSTRCNHFEGSKKIEVLYVLRKWPNLSNLVFPFCGGWPWLSVCWYRCELRV